MSTTTAFSHSHLRQHGFGADVDIPFSVLSDLAVLKAHRDYQAAKAGDISAAMNLVWDLAAMSIVEYTHRFPSHCIFVAPHAQEASGDNAIPQVLAEVCALVRMATADTDIVQTTRVFHTGADPMERMALRAQFEGAVLAQGQYVLVDDVSNMGGTLAELANYIYSHGGYVVGVMVLVNAGRSPHLKPDAKSIRKLETRYGHEITQLFGIEPSALTANEAHYLIGFRTIDEIRNRLAKARQETHLRLRSKGIGSEDPGQAAG